MSYKYSMLLSTDQILLSTNNLVLTFDGCGLALFNWMIKTNISETENVVITIYPNPTTGEIVISNSGIKPGSLHIDLTNVTGVLVRVLFDGIYDGTELRFNVSGVATGTYFLKAVQGNSTYSYKLIKENWDEENIDFIVMILHSQNYVFDLLKLRLNFGSGNH